MSNKKNSGKIPSLGWIIFLFCCPGFQWIAVILLFIRLNRKYSKTFTPVTEDNQPIKNFRPGASYSVIRNILLTVGLLFGIGLCAQISDAIRYGWIDWEDSIITFAISAICFFFAYKRSVKLKKYQPYLNYLAAYGTDLIDDLAGSLNVSKEEAVQTLGEMISERIINAHISADGYIVISSDPNKVPSKSRYETKFIRCPFCGAPNAIKPGAQAKCEYCDSPLE